MANISAFFKNELKTAVSVYRISKKMANVILLSPLIIVILYSLFLIYPATRSFTILTLTENYPVELLTFFGLFFGGILSILLAIRAYKRGENLYLVLFYTLVGLGFVFVGMEEISWGQTFFQFTTPDFLVGVNQQGEISFHNMPGLQN